MMKKREVCWLITTRCNQKCAYCHGFRNIPELSYEENEEVLSKLIRAGVNYITFSGGEALLYPNILDLLKIARQNGVKSKLITNGSLIANNEKVREIVDYLDTITLSLDTTRDEINEQMGRGRNHFTEIKKILDILKNKDIRIKINTVVTKLNIDYIEELGEFLDTNYKINEWRIFRFAPLRELAKENEKKFEITNEQFKSTKEIFQKNYKNIGKVNYRDNDDMESKYNLVTANGDIVRTINKKDVVIGNALHQGVNEIVKIMNEDYDRDYLKDKIKVLVSYDNENVVNRFVKAINNIDYAEVVATAKNFDETFDKIMEKRPDMVFSRFDINMIKKSEEKLEQNVPVFNLIESDIGLKEFQNAMRISGNKINALVKEPFEPRIENILKDYKEYIYK